MEVTKQEEKLVQKEDELKQVREKLDTLAKNTQEYERKYQQALVEKTTLAEQLQAEIELCAEAEESRSRLMARKQELEDMMQELETRIEEEEERVLALGGEKRNLSLIFKIWKSNSKKKRPHAKNYNWRKCSSTLKLKSTKKILR